MPRHTRLSRLTAIGALVLLAGLLGPAAQAHDALEGTDPADGSTLDVAPTQITLTFAETPLAVGTELAVTGPDGTAVQQGAVQVSGTQVIQPLATGLAAGAYTVDWRVTSADGHVVSGTFGFTLSAAAAPTPTPVATQASTPTAEPTKEPLVIAPSPTPTPSAAVATSSGRSGPMVWIVVVAAVLAVAAAGYVALRRRR